MYWKEQLQITNPKITKCSQPCNNSQYEQLNDQSIQVADNTKMSYISKTCITYGIILSLITIDAHDLILEKSWNDATK